MFENNDYDVVAVRVGEGKVKVVQSTTPRITNGSYATESALASVCESESITYTVIEAING